MICSKIVAQYTCLVSVRLVPYVNLLIVARILVVLTTFFLSYTTCLQKFRQLSRVTLKSLTLLTSYKVINPSLISRELLSFIVLYVLVLKKYIRLNFSRANLDLYITTQCLYRQYTSLILAITQAALSSIIRKLTSLIQPTKLTVKVSIKKVLVISSRSTLQKRYRIRLSRDPYKILIYIAIFLVECSGSLSIVNLSIRKLQTQVAYFLPSLRFKRLCISR